MAKPNMSADDMMAMLKAVQGNLKDGDTKITENELSGLMKLFQDPSMVSELNNYMNEMADPKFKAEQEEWIRQEETKGNVPEGRTVVHPKPAGLSFYTHYKKGTAREGQPFVVNLVRADEVGRPEISPASDGSGAASVRVPAVAGPVRMEKGAGVGPLVGKGPEDTIWTVDVGVHTEAVARMMGTAATAKQWRKLLTEVALEQADRRAQQEAGKVQGLGAIPLRTGEDMQLLALQKETKELKKGYVAGTPEPPSMLVPTAEAAATSSSSSSSSTQPAQASSSASGVGKAATSAAGGSKPVEAKSSVSKSAPATPPVKVLKGPDGVYLRAPGYSIVERNPFQLADHMKGGAPGSPAGAAASTRPREIKVDIALPGVSRAAELDMDNDERELSVTTTTVFHDEPLKPTPAPNSAGAALSALLGKVGTSPAPFRYHTKIKLPYPVSLDERDTKAKWDRDTGVLTVTFAVQPPPAAPAAPAEQSKQTSTSTTTSSSEESELDDAKKVKATSSTSTARPVAPEKLPEAHSAWVKERVQATGAVPLSPPIPTSPSPSAPSMSEDPSLRAGGEPPYRWRQMPGMVSVLFDVPAVDKESVSLEWAGAQSEIAQDLTISFKSKSSPIDVAVAAGHAGAAQLASQQAEGAKGLSYLYSVQLRLAGKVKTGAPTRIDVSDANVALILSKEKEVKWKDLVRAPPEDVEVAAAAGGGNTTSSPASPAKPAAAPSPAPTPAPAASGPSTSQSYAVPPDSQRCKMCRGWGKDLLQADGYCGHCSKKAQAMYGSEKTDRVTAGPSTPAPAPAPAPVQALAAEEEEIFELGSNGSFDITKSKRKTPVPTAQPTSASKSAGKAPKAAGLFDLD